MTKKELIKRIEEYKPKYIYQRYDGRIHKYEVVNDNYLVETKTGMSFDFRSHLMLGKVSEDLIDLIQCEDYVNGRKIERIVDISHKHNSIIVVYDGELWNEEIMKEDIENIVTKEQFESISYKVEE